MAIESSLLAVGFLAYRQVRYVTRDDVAAAEHNAQRVLDLERHLPGLTEHAVQKVALDSEAAVWFLNRYYVSVHFPLTTAFVVWLMLRHPGTYRPVRTWLLIVTGAALAIHVAYPLAPPRMLPGFVDTLRTYGPNIYPADPGASMANQFAAMPSLHFGWALLVATGVVVTIRRRWAWTAMAHPAITLVAIVATGNHYFLDAAIAGLLVLAAVIAVPIRQTSTTATTTTAKAHSPMSMTIRPRPRGTPAPHNFTLDIFSRHPHT